MTIERAHLTGHLWLVTATGRLDQSQAVQLEAILQELLSEGHNRLIVDMAGVDYINSGGLRCLVTAWRLARQENGDILLCSMTPRVYDIFKMIGFDKVFRIFPDREEASQYWQQAG